MAQLQHDLREGMYQWIEATGGGTITRLERHVARREAWVVDVTRPDGSVLEGFLRLERQAPTGVTSTSLLKETKIIEALAAVLTEHTGKQHRIARFNPKVGWAVGG